MAIIDDVSSQMKDAMRARDKPRVQALRGIRAAFIEALKADGAETLADSAALPILKRLAKQRQESIDAYVKGGREELAAAERVELGVIEAWLPKAADEATTKAWVEAAIASTGASSMRDMGKVMGALMKGHRDELDGKLANTLVRQLLG